MTKSEAEALVLFVKDHDTRFLAKAGGEGDERRVELTSHNGEKLEPILTVEDYRQRYIVADASSTSVRTAWEKWKP